MAQRIVAGRYELLERLGPGWRARDADLGREVVVLIGGEAGAPPAHPSIGRIFDRGEADGEQFAVFEYLPDPSGATEIEAATLIQAPQPPARRRLPPTRTLAIVAGVVLLALAGIGAAFLATAESSSTEEPTTGSLSVPAPTGTSAPSTEESEPPTTTEPETTTQEQTTAPAPTTAPPPTTAPTVTEAATTAPPPPPPPPTTAPPPPTTEPPPTTTEEPPPPTTG